MFKLIKYTAVITQNAAGTGGVLRCSEDLSFLTVRIVVLVFLFIFVFLALVVFVVHVILVVLICVFVLVILILIVFVHDYNHAPFAIYFSAGNVFIFMDNYDKMKNCI